MHQLGKAEYERLKLMAQPRETAKRIRRDHRWASNGKNRIKGGSGRTSERQVTGREKSLARCCRKVG